MLAISTQKGRIKIP